VCVLRGGFSRVEQTLLDGGRGPAVIQQRMDFQVASQKCCKWLGGAVRETA